VLDGALKGLITGIVAVFVLGLIFLLGKLAGGGAIKQPGATVLRYGGFFRGVALLGLFIPAVLIVCVFVLPAPGGGTVGYLVLGGIGAAFLALEAGLLLEAFRRRIVLSETGISAHGWFGPVGEQQWSEIEKIENRVGSGKYVVFGGKAKIALGHYLDGLDVFAAECKKRLAPEVYGDAFEKPVNRPFM
jgi:hypothetical protein